MKKRVCFATGCFYLWSDDQNEQINLTKGFDLDGVELTFAYVKEVKNFSLSGENEAYLKSLEWNSIHAPFKYTFGKNKESERILERFQDLYKKVNAKNFVVHPDRIEDFSQVLGKGMDVSTENLVGYEIGELEKILDKHPDLGLVLDVTHSAANSPTQVREIYELFHDRITEIHCSSYLYGKRHQFLHKADKRFLNEIRVIKSLDVPLVIELNLSKDVTKNLIKKEVAFLRDWYK